ncbi:Hypothetical predicted protein [Cloeon dipterum]|uniref:MYND-type domain-containing protein n=1 Tax=Cloeon dipterum TaxID=197152 RepID=A0A8S1CRG0_9INSE|nr:Hypothetical predicted protein [Cloeon dipterum]
MRKIASNKSSIRSARLLKKSEESLKEYKYHLTLKTLNQALAFAKEKEIIKKIESQRQLVLATSGLNSEINLKTGDSWDYTERKEWNNCFKWTSEIPKLLIGKNREIGAFSAAVELQYNEEFGRHLIALQPIPPGCVIGVELPFANVLHSSCKYTHCSQCLAKAHFLIPCQNCTQAMYCSESCRVAAWSEHHAVECQIAGQLQTAGLSPVDVLAVRVLSLSKPDEILRCQAGGKRNSRCAGFSSTGRFESDSLYAFMHIHCNPQGWTFEETLRQLVTALLILRVYGLDKHPQSIQLAVFVLRNLQSIPHNSHEIAERCNCNGGKLSDHGIALGVPRLEYPAEFLAQLQALGANDSMSPHARRLG